MFNLYRYIAYALIVFTLTASGYVQPAAAAQKAQSIQFLLSQVRASGVALSGGRVDFYEAGATTTRKTVWLDRNKATSAANPYTLDSNGTAQLYGDGLYRIVIKDSAGVTKYDRDYISIKDASGNVYDVADYASLAAAVASIGSTPATLQFATDVTVSANLVIPATLELMPLNGAKINHTTYTVAVNSSTVRWPVAQIFNGTGLVTLGNASDIPPQWFGAKGDNVNDDTAALNAASESAHFSDNGGPLRPTVFLPPGRYHITDSWKLRDYASVRGAGTRQVIISGALTNKSFLRPYVSETPTTLQSVVGLNLRNFTIQNDTVYGTGSIGLNMRQVGYSFIERIHIYNMDIGLATDTKSYYTEFEKIWIQANTGMYLKSDGGGNSLTACHIAGNVIALDIYSGVFEINGGTYEALTATATHTIRVGTADAGVPDAVVTAVGVYVEGEAVATVPIEFGASTRTSAVYNMNIHNVMGAIVNNAPEGSLLLDVAGYYTPTMRTQKLIFSNAINGALHASLSAPGGNEIQTTNNAGTDYADFRVKGLFTHGAETHLATPVYANNAAAITGGLPVGRRYVTPTGAVMQVYTP